MLDLQLHTTDSDGTWVWNDVLEECLKMGLTAFAITDHDTIVRCKDVRAWGQERKVQAIPGIELSAHEKDQTVHLLGYFLEGPLKHLESKLEFLRDARRERNKKIIRKLQQLGHAITEDDVARVAGKGTLGRPHIARALLEIGAVRTMKEAFDRFLAVGGAAYFPKEELPLREAIDLLHEAGAVTSVAHPLLLKRSLEELELSIKTWTSWGLDALEGFYPIYTAEQTGFMGRMAQKYTLLLTGGSDFHGENKSHIHIGTGTGSLNVPDELLEPLFKRRDEINRHLKVS